MRELVKLRRGVVFLIALAVGMASSSAVACPRADSCPDMVKKVRHSCCGGDGQGRAPAPETRNECPGDCCRPASDLPIESDALPAPAPSVDALLSPAAALSAPRDPKWVPVSDTGPPDRTFVPVFLLVSSLLI